MNVGMAVAGSIGGVMKSRMWVALCLLQLAAWICSIGTLQAQDKPERLTIWDIHIGDAASDIPDEFAAYAKLAYGKGFLMVSASPLTRSSHHAGEDFARLQAARAAMSR